LHLGQNVAGPECETDKKQAISEQLEQFEQHIWSKLAEAEKLLIFNRNRIHIVTADLLTDVLAESMTICTAAMAFLVIPAEALNLPQDLMDMEATSRRATVLEKALVQLLIQLVTDVGHRISSLRCSP